MLTAIPGNVIFIEGGFRNSSTWCFIAANTAVQQLSAQVTALQAKVGV